MYIRSERFMPGAYADDIPFKTAAAFTCVAIAPHVAFPLAPERLPGLAVAENRCHSCDYNNENSP